MTDKTKRVVDIKDFSALVVKGESVDNCTVRKQLTVEVKMLDEAKRIIRFIASTGAVDRDKDTLAVDGWDTTDYRKNPVFLWCHDYKTPPIGKCVGDYVLNGQLVEDIQFIDPQELYPGMELKAMPDWVQFADMTYKLYKGGYMSAVSVGFDPVDYQRNQLGGVDFKKQKQLELSAVPVPANQEALRVAGIEGIDTKSLEIWAKKSLKSLETAETKKYLAGSIDQMVTEAIFQYFNLTEDTGWVWIDAFYPDSVVAFTVEVREPYSYEIYRAGYRINGSIVELTTVPEKMEWQSTLVPAKGVGNVTDTKVNKSVGDLTVDVNLKGIEESISALDRLKAKAQEVLDVYTQIETKTKSLEPQTPPADPPVVEDTIEVIDNAEHAETGDTIEVDFTAEDITKAVKEVIMQETGKIIN